MTIKNIVNTYSGKLFVFEGIDQVGKSTIVKEVGVKLKNLKIQYSIYSFPGKQDGTLGALVYDLHHNENKYLNKSLDPLSLQMLHVAAHIDIINNQIIPDLKEGKIVLLDRFWWSTYAYGLANGIKRNLINDIIKPERKALKKVEITQYFLIKRNTESSRNNNYYNSILSTYERLANEEDKHNLVTIINNNLQLNDSINDIFKRIIETTTEKTNPVDHPHIIHDSTSVIGDFMLHIKTPKIRTAPIYDTYWKFAVERQNIFFNRYYEIMDQWTDDPILQKYKFTNAYRASDRVSQYLIKNIIYNENSYSREDQFFRIMLFKLFNKIETWEYLQKQFGDITYKDYKYVHYDRAFLEALNNKETIYSAAYIMPSGQSSFGHAKKHQNNLKLLERIMDDHLPTKIGYFKTMEELYTTLLSYPTLGKFLAFQYCVDINYSELCNFEENSFVVAGPGAINGINKCFHNNQEYSNEDIIKYVTDLQEMEFKRLDLNFKSLWGRSLQLVDCQNLFCETDKYSRVAFPSSHISSDRKRIKQLFVPHGKIDLFYPPKWKINQHIEMVKI
ncbi:Thymidylate kinase [compost metagenome]